MVNGKTKTPTVNLVEFLNNHPTLASGKVELLAMFAHWMENGKKITQATDNDFKGYFEEFKSISFC